MGNQLKIIRIPIPTPTLWPSTTTNCYLIGNKEESILIDAGYDQQETIELLEKTVKEHQLPIPKKIILTHYHLDHARGVRQLIKWNPTVYCHEKELNEIKNEVHPIDHITLLKDNDFVEIAGEKLKIYHTPGHTRGHVSVYIPSEKILLAGDNFVTEGTSWIGPPDGDMKDYLETLEKLKKIPLAKIGPGHGTWIKDPYKQIDFVIERRMLREKQILSLLAEHGKLTAKELMDFIYNEKIHPSVYEVATRTVEAHLKKLIDEGRVSVENDSYSGRYFIN